MDIMSRNAHPGNPHPGNPQPTQVHPVVEKQPKPEHKNSGMSSYKLYRIGVVAAVAAIVVLLIGITLLLYANNSNTKDTESSYIKDSKLQAVFLNTGQVYFGNINVLNNNFFVLSNIFYLQSNSSSTTATTSTSSSDVTLVKLGCELHMPYDQMVINRSEVTFWENLQSNGQVAKAVATWEKEHPKGQQCTDQSSSSTSTSSAVQNANNGSTSGTSTTGGTATTGTGTTGTGTEGTTSTTP
jgi:hypothetical protein